MLHTARHNSVVASVSSLPLRRVISHLLGLVRCVIRVAAPVADHSGQAEEGESTRVQNVACALSLYNEPVATPIMLKVGGVCTCLLTSLCVTKTSHLFCCDAQRAMVRKSTCGFFSIASLWPTHANAHMKIHARAFSRCQLRHADAQHRVGSVLWAVLRVHCVVAVGVRAHDRGQVHVCSHGRVGCRACFCVVYAVEAVGVG